MKIDIKIEVELSQEEFDLLKKINTHGYAEYRDPEYETLDSFLSHHEGDIFRPASWYLERNFNGTLLAAIELANKDLVMVNLDSWHLVYMVSKLGKSLLEQHKNGN